MTWRLLPACLVAGAAASVALGQDANWDLLAYHLQNGAGLLHGRFWADLVPAGMQSYLNPLLDASYAWLALGPLGGHPRVVAAIMGAWFGLLLFGAVRLGRALRLGWVAVAAGVGLGASSMAVLPQVGTTTNEVQAGALMVGGLSVLLTAGAGRQRAAVGGALFGMAAGLKMTATAFAPAFGAAALVVGGPPAAAAAAGGWLAGFAAADGWWAALLMERFGSPVFPLFNGLFRSEWYPPASVIDDRFFPRGWLHWVAYPFFWTAGSAVRPAELPFQDLRGAAAMAIGAVAAIVAVVRRVRPGRAEAALLGFLVVGYGTWLGTSSILRYAVVLAMAAGLAVPVLLARIMGTWAAGPAAMLVLIGAVATTQYSTPQRIAWQPVRAEMGWVEPGTLIVVTFRGPSSHAVAAMPQRPGVRVLHVGTAVLEARGWRLHDEAVRLVAEHAGPIVVVTEGHPAGRFPELGEVGIDPALGPCRPIDSTLLPSHASGLHACEAARRALPVLKSAFWRVAAGRFRTVFQPADAGLTLVGAAYLQAAGPVARGTRFIDWTDLVWGGLTRSRDVLPPALDPGTLYVVAPEFRAALAARIGPGDLLADIDGWVVGAPGMSGFVP